MKGPTPPEQRSTISLFTEAKLKDQREAKGKEVNHFHIEFMYLRCGLTYRLCEFT